MLENLTTEAINSASARIDTLGSLDIVRVINAEDARVASAVAAQEHAIAQAIDFVTHAFQNQGRLIYIGAGTSGRLGVLDASECPPTFRSDPRQVVGIIAGGFDALVRAIEGAEDDLHQAEKDLRKIDFSHRDVLIGIATSGRTPYVLGGLQYANTIGAISIGLVCNDESEIAKVARCTIAPIVGPEVISGSTRMKAGTATKMVLNMITTGAMIRVGKTYGNLMVDLRATNTKLIARATRLVSQLAQVDESVAGELLTRSAGEVKTAIVMQLRNVDVEYARELLSQSNGHLRSVIGDRE